MKKRKPYILKAHEVMLDVKLVLPPATSRELFHVGTWITVLGYVAFPTTKNKNATERTEDENAQVQALLVLACGHGVSSGGMQDEKYVKALEARRKAMRLMEKARNAG